MFGIGADDSTVSLINCNEIDNSVVSSEDNDNCNE